jgi:hypothetical protein
VVPTEKPESTPVAEPELKVEPESGPESADDGESTPAPESKESADAIPDSHYRAALHMGMKADEIGALYDQSPELALKTLAKCYEMVNASSKQLGELGQRARQLRETAPEVPAQPVVNRKAEVKAMLRKEYDDSPALEALVDLLPDTPVETKAPQSPATERSIDEEIAVRQEINTFFSADDMQPYEDFYGKNASQTGDWRHLTPGQSANRKETCRRAQFILNGAAMAGMPMSAAEALERAHLEVAAPMLEQVVRERIVKSVQKRAAGVTLKPSGSKTPAPAVGAYSKEKAIEETRAELSKLFGSP